MRLSLFNSDLSSGTAVLAIARHEGGVFTIGGNRLLRSFILKFSTMSDSRLCDEMSTSSPSLLYQQSRLATSGSRRAKLLRAAHAAVSTVRTCNHGATSCSLSANSRRKLYPSHDQRKKRDPRAIVDISIIDCA